MKIIGYIMIIAIFLFVSGIIYFIVSLNQMINEREQCRHTPLNQMNENDYRYCLQYLGDK